MAIPWVEMVSSLIRASSAQHPFRAFSELNRKAAAGVSTGEAATPDVDTSSDDSTVVPPGAPDPDSPGYKDMVSKLEARNAHVMEHEAAHLAAAGAYAKGGATYTYQIGPDGKPYAIGGQVNVDLNAVPGNPRATIVKMRAIQAAASAPDDPSGQDNSVASAAAKIEAEATAQLEEQSREALASNSTGHSAAQPYQSKPNAVGNFVNATA